MLVQLAVENFTSFDEEIEFSMISSGLKGHEKHKRKTEFSKPESLLRLGSVFGGNASGKTNLMKALRVMQKLLAEGTHKGEKLPWRPFKLRPESRKNPSLIECILYLDGQLYTYGIVFNDRDIVEEWLYAQRPAAQERKLFERKTENGETKVSIGQSITEKNYTPKVFQMVAATTRQNQPYLYELYQKNHEGIRPIVKWFTETLQLIPAVAQYRELTNRAIVDKEFINLLSKVLQKVDVGIKRLEPYERNIDIYKELGHLPNEIIEDLITKLKEGDKGDIIFISSELNQRGYRLKEDGFEEIALKTVREDVHGNEVHFDLEEESDGTNRLLHLLPALADISNSTRVIFIDELDRRLHPILSQSLIRLFNQLVPDEANSQFIFTTHDTNLFNLDLFRRDELWVMEKNSAGATQLNSLAEYGVREKPNLGEDYLMGRFGGIPNIRYELSSTH